jgi:hypothetical protein
MILSPQTRARMARSTAVLVMMPELYEVVEAEARAVFFENPELPETERTKHVVWALAFQALHQFSSAVSTPANQTQEQQKIE